MELRLRPYKPTDAEKIVSWIKDEEALRKWSSDRFGNFPITSDDINNKYLKNSGELQRWRLSDKWRKGDLYEIIKWQ